MGSFYNVVAYRINKKDYKGIMTDRSNCPNCKTKLKAKDLVPLLSYLFLKGKCRYCKKDIPFIYFIFELITGIGFVLVYVFFSNWQIGLFLLSLFLTMLNIIYRKIK